MSLRDKINMKKPAIKKTVTITARMGDDSYNSFEVQIDLEKDSGLTSRDIEGARKEANDLCQKSIDERRKSIERIGFKKIN